MSTIQEFQKMGRIWPRASHSIIRIIDEWASLNVRTTQDVHNDNYFFGSALQHHKHVDAKIYHTLGQRGKVQFRQKFEKRARSKHPHMAKHAAVWKSYIALRVAASLGD